MRHKIMIYQDERSASGQMVNSLMETFSAAQFSFSRVGIADIRQGILQNGATGLFVLPGIYGEDCLYHDDFDLPAQNEYHCFLENGGVSLNSCAGASAMSRVCDYQTDWGTIKHKTNLHPLFNGHARGPLAPYAIPPQHARIESTLPQIANTSIAPVLFKDEDGAWQEARICYGNGPALIPENPHDPAMEILAVYSKLKAHLPALTRLSRGKGAAYLCGVHPEIGPFEIAANAGARLERLRTLSNALKPHEEGRQKFWAMLTNRIKSDLKCGNFITDIQRKPVLT